MSLRPREFCLKGTQVCAMFQRILCQYVELGQLFIDLLKLWHKKDLLGFEQDIELQLKARTIL